MALVYPPRCWWAFWSEHVSNPHLEGNRLKARRCLFFFPSAIYTYIVGNSWQWEFAICEQNFIWLLSIILSWKEPVCKSDWCSSLCSGYHLESSTFTQKVALTCMQNVPSCNSKYFYLSGKEWELSLRFRITPKSITWHFGLKKNYFKFYRR